MIIGVISDSHDNIEYLEEALTRLDSCDLILHCGDVSGQEAAQVLAEHKVVVHVVQGNTDTFSTDDLDGVVYHEGSAELTLDGQEVFMTHFPEIAQIAAMSPSFDVVFHGHTHVQNDLVVDGTHMVNPGELEGRTPHTGYAVYDTEDNSITLETLFLER